ncbi:MAG: HEPN domain-containing protein [Lewinellaceae bacterium]|nr:HEPN domain-containing protein [Saprospiraceae bacterium]MCB9336967.1 HEPN domain-containing protein [Lewinellaceae bacterium]
MSIDNLHQIPDPRNVRDIIDLRNKIESFKKGEIDAERFKHFRLTRGVYGQRQQGVHMFRTKLPIGKLTARQLTALADISEKYATGNLHLTTRQNVQFHYVKLDDSTAIWREMAAVGLNAREACGNTVRNVTASANAGIDPHEPFDISPYAIALYEHFLRNPICQEMGRKIKIAFSSSDFDTAYTYFHDFGFIPKIQDGKRGFKIVIGGGLGAQSMVAQTAHEFIEEDKFLPFTEAVIRVFDRLGEREKRFKARMKFLLKDLGLEEFLRLVGIESTAVAKDSIPVNHESWKEAETPSPSPAWITTETTGADFDRWKTANVFAQKQSGLFGVQIKLKLGNISAETARQFAAIAKTFAADDIRLTVNQGFLLRHVRPEALAPLYLALKKLNLADVGFGSIADITACPGTDTCNLGVTNSTGLATKLDEVLATEHPDLLLEKDIQIKISGCMNSCGQHMAAQIGFHGSSIKVGGKVAPAMQVVLGGGIEPNGKTYIGDKVIKLPTKRIPDALRLVVDDFLANRNNGQTFNEYYYDHEKSFFYDLLKPLADTASLNDEDFKDWGNAAEEYVQAIGVGECAGAAVDVIATILNDANIRLDEAGLYLANSNWEGAIYNAYSAMVIAAKALLLADDVRCNTHQKIIEDFQQHYVATGQITSTADFVGLVSAINKNEPTEDFARDYLAISKAFYKETSQLRSAQLAEVGEDKAVIADFYRA